MFCTNCGSQNHKADDCSKPKPATPFVPPAPIAPTAPPPKPVAAPKAKEPPVIKHRMAGMLDVCTATHLLRFETAKAAGSYAADNCPDTGYAPSECKECGGHHLTKKPDEEPKNETGWRKPAFPFLRKETRREMDYRTGHMCVAEDQKLREPIEVEKEERAVAMPRAKKKPADEPGLFG